MSLEGAYQRELALIEEQYNNGTIELKERNFLIGELEAEARQEYSDQHMENEEEY